MIKIRKTKNIFEEAQFINEQRLDYNLLKVLAGERAYPEHVELPAS